MSDDEDYADDGDEGAYSGDEDYLDVVDEEQRAKAAAEAEKQAAAEAEQQAELARAQAVADAKEKLATACRERALQEKEKQATVEQDWLSRGRPPWVDVEPFEGGLRLFDSDSDAEEYSSAMLKALTGKHHGFSSIDTGDAKVLLACPAPTSLGLKLGSRVLVLKDIEIAEEDTRIRSGTAGYVLEFEYRRDKEGSITDVGVVVAFTPEAGPPFTYTFATCLSLENTFESRGVRGYAGEALAAVVRSEGLFRGLFKGYGATLAVWGPWNMLYFAMYEAAKDACAAHMGLARPRGGEAEELPAWACAGAAAAAASGACVLTQPLDTAKVRALRFACATGLRRMQPRRAYSERHEQHALRSPGLTRAICHACTHADASAGRARQ